MMVVALLGRTPLTKLHIYIRGARQASGGENKKNRVRTLRRRYIASLTILSSNDGQAHFVIAAKFL